MKKIGKHILLLAFTLQVSLVTLVGCRPTKENEVTEVTEMKVIFKENLGHKTEVGNKVTDLDSYLDIMEEHGFEDVYYGFDVDMTKEEFEEYEAKMKLLEEEEHAKERKSWYSDDSKNYIIVSEVGYSQMLKRESFKVNGIKYNDTLKTVTVYVEREFHGCVSNSEYYIVAIPTDKCDESYTVNIELAEKSDKSGALIK